MKRIRQESVSSQQLINYTNIALKNAKLYLKRNDKVMAVEGYKRYRNLKDMLDCFVYERQKIHWKK